MQAVAIIPARYGSTRFPGKPLALLHGRPMIWWVWSRIRRSRRIQRVVVATDDRRVADAVRRFGGEARLTSTRHRTGTERVAEVARTLKAPIVVNVQGDEPAIDSRTVDAVVRGLLEDPGAGMSTAALPFADDRSWRDPAQVKVVLDRRGRALYFSRAPVPATRRPLRRGRSPGLKHIGIYGYRRSVLLQLARWKPTPLEESEVLEQLRALEHGVPIRVVRASADSVGVDRPEDIPRAERLLPKVP